MAERDGAPLWISPEPASAIRLERADLRPSGENGRVYDEAWLQRLLHQNPEVLPIEQIEPGFGKLVPLCRELPLPLGANQTGYLDNLFATADGRLVLVEAKLWRNHEARRAVIAQALEYAASIFRLGYEELQSAVLQARKHDVPQVASLHEIIACHHRPVDETEFLDAVSRNLSRGRAIIAVVGDGIREELISIAELLQSHAGHRFTFALVELKIYEAPQHGARIVVPSVLAQTQFIERGVVQIEDALGNKPRITIRSLDEVSLASPSPRHPFGIGEDEFYEALGQKFPDLPRSLKQFLEKALSLGIHPEWQNGLNLKHSVPEGSPLNLGAVWKDGIVDIGGTAVGERAAAVRRYNDSVASHIGGFVRESKHYIGVRTAAGRMPRIVDLLPKHQDAWLESMERYIGDVLNASNQPVGRQSWPDSP
jgi:hypothetical protein